MSKKITITITGASTPREVSNAVRRVFHEGDMSLTVGEEATVKGVSYRVREVADKPESAYVPIRAWAAKNGYSLGKRGRVPAEVLEAYATAK